MNLNTINEVKRPTSADQITQWRDGYAWLAGIARPQERFLSMKLLLNSS